MLNVPLIAPLISLVVLAYLFNAGTPFHFFAYQLSDYLGDQDTDGLPRLALHTFPIRGPCTFKIFVKTLTGKTEVVWVDRFMTIDYVKDLIEIETGTPKDQMRLIFSGKCEKPWWLQHLALTLYPLYPTL